MDGRCRVAYGALRMSAVLLYAGDGFFEVARIVQRVEHSEDIHAVFACERDETLNYIVGIVLVAKQILPAKKHLKRRLLADLFQLAQTFPWILAQETHAYVERRAPPAFKRVITRRVYLLGDLQNIVSPHACRPKRLVRIAKCRVRDSDSTCGFFFHHPILYHILPRLCAICDYFCLAQFVQDTVS